MFWGLIVEPNKRYTQVVEKPFHISQAAMDTSTGDNEPCQVMVVVDGKNFLICTLQKNKNIQVPLDLYFKQGDNISFLTNGKCNIHLTGYLDPEFEGLSDEEEAEEEEEEEEEVPKLVAGKNKRKLENNVEANSSKKAKQEKAKAKAAPAESSDDDDDADDQLQKLLDGEDVETDDNDESFKVNTTAEDSDDDEEGSDEEEEEEDEEEEDDEADEKESSEEADTTLDTSKDDSKIDTSKLTKSQKRRLRKKQKALENKTEQVKMNGTEKPKKEKPEPKAEKKKEKKEAQEAPAADKKEKKSLSGGVQIEDMKVGNGPVAKPGKTVMVYYEGRLKQNNKMFDNCLKGSGFKFRLGAKEVISGWDIGVNGMKVGGKRKIICPPAMAYGAKGSPPVIPPNSTLVFEVELKNVK